MSVLEIVLRLAAGVLLVLTNAFFVVSEFALTRLRQHDREELGDDPRLDRAWDMTERLEIYLTGCQLGISASSILLGIVAEPAITHMLEPLFSTVGLQGNSAHVTSVVLAVLVMNLIHKIWGEQAPTYWGVEQPIRLAKYTAGPLYWWTKVMKPFILFGDGAAKWTLGLFGVKIERSWLEAEEEGGSDGNGGEGAGEGPITSITQARGRMKRVLAKSPIDRERRQEVLAALEIEEVPVRDIMVPRDDVVSVSTTRSIEESLETIRKASYNRYPLVGESLEDYRGNLYVPEIFRKLKELEAGDSTLEDVATEPMFLPADEPVSAVIDRFQEENQELALVREVEDDEGGKDGDRGRIVGLVTATDAFEAIAGELEDPYD